MKDPTSANKSGKKVKKKSTRRKKSLPEKPAREQGIDKGKVIIKPDFDEPLCDYNSEIPPAHNLV